MYEGVNGPWGDKGMTAIPNGRSFLDGRHTVPNSNKSATPAPPAPKTSAGYGAGFVPSQVGAGSGLARPGGPLHYATGAPHGMAPPAGSALPQPRAAGGAYGSHSTPPGYSGPAIPHMR